MTAVTIELARGTGKIDIPLSTAKDLRHVQVEKENTFTKAWERGSRHVRRHGVSRAQAHTLWALVAFDPSQQTSEFETLLELEANCVIEPDGVAWVVIEGTQLRFTPADRWCYATEFHQYYHYLHLVVARILGRNPGEE